MSWTALDGWNFEPSTQKCPSLLMFGRLDGLDGSSFFK
jgi:hypothetical protein